MEEAGDVRNRVAARSLGARRVGAYHMGEASDVRSGVAAKVL